MDLMASTITIASVITIGMFVLGILTYLSNRKRNDKDDTEQVRKQASEDEARMVRMETMLANIDKNTTNINTRVNDHDKLLTKHETRISVIESKMGITKGEK